MADGNIVAGIDYSLTNPCMCILKGEPLYTNCEFFYLTEIKKFQGVFDNRIYGSSIPEYENNIERFDKLSDYFVSIIKSRDIKIVGLEDYSIGSRNGLVFNIAEATGLLKYKLNKLGCTILLHSPKTIKKHGSTSGNSDKTMMYESFKEKTGIDLCSILGYTRDKIGSPVGDIIDSFYCSTLTNEKIHE